MHCFDWCHIMTTVLRNNIQLPTYSMYGLPTKLGTSGVFHDGKYTSPVEQTWAASPIHPPSPSPLDDLQARGVSGPSAMYLAELNQRDGVGDAQNLEAIRPVGKGTTPVRGLTNHGY